MPQTEIIAKYYKVLNGRTQCLLCPQLCKIQEDKVGICRTRTNKDGKLIVTNYGEITSLAVDPIEKKPLYHFYPGADILSIGGKGCNLSCIFCQNWHISHGEISTRYLSPEQLLEKALSAESNIGVSFTYNEPLIWFEYIFDCAQLLRSNDMKVVLVTNGFINPEPLKEILPLIDAMNIDLKSYEDDFYKKYCGGRLDPVKETIKTASDAGVHVEVTLLIIPTINDDEKKLVEMTDWLASVDDMIPFHISRYFPAYKLDLPPTPVDTLRRVYDIASKKMKYVYLGNQTEFIYTHTFCPACRNVLIERSGYSVRIAGIAEGNCARCGREVDIIGI